jgi:hypothetical protein
MLVNSLNGTLGFFGSLLEHDYDDHSNTGKPPLVETCL